MAHQFLNRFERNACHDQPAAERMPEAVPTEIFDSSLGARFVQPASNGLADEWLSFICYENTF
jgi:hypothetical protein